MNIGHKPVTAVPVCRCSLNIPCKVSVGQCQNLFYSHLKLYCSMNKIIIVSLVNETLHFKDYEKKRENYKEMTDSKTYRMLLFILEMDKI